MSLALTRIRLHGFKTFAQRTEIDLAANLTAIVGPNGCGKSNLVDAIVWALGEANVRLLRAQTPTEVVFSGSSAHKPLGLAEVSLWFDNTPRWLPIDADEVQITRRIYRSGEWECWINRTPARLRDVADLFAGTGLGRGGYAIVGQGDIEALLNASPEERRLWLEEVAGIALYRNRRKEALRDLEAARLHLTRVDDVLRELERQREPLRHEAERALVYRELQHQLHQMERAYLQYEYTQLQIRAARARAERDTLYQQIHDTTQAIQNHEAQADTYGNALAQLEAEMDTLRTALQSHLTTEERLLGERNRLDERERALHELARTLQEEAHSLHAQEQAHNTRIQELQAELHALETEAHTLAPTIHNAETELNRLDAERRALETAYQSALRQRTQREYALQHLQRLHAEATAIEAQLQSLAVERDTLQTTLERAQADEHTLHTEVEQLETAQRESEQKLNHHLREVQHYARRVETLRARLRALEASLQAGEGASPAVRALLNALRKGELQGEFVPVGAALTVPDAYQAALSAALGNAVNDIITPTEAEARSAIEWLKAHRAGRLTFLPLELLEPRAAELPPMLAAQAQGILGIAAELVAYEPRFEPAVHHLLGRVLIVDTLENATRLVRLLRQHGYARAFSRLATLDGSVVQLSGAITGGAQPHERSTLLQLKAELERTRAELADAEAQLQHAETALEHHRAAHHQRQQLLEGRRRQLREVAHTRLRLESELRQRQRDLHHYDSQLARVREQIATLEAQLSAETTADFTALEAQREQLHARHDALTRQLAQLRAQSQQLATRQRELQRQLDAEQRALSQLRERQQSRQARLYALHAEQAQLQAQRARLDDELQRVRAQIADAQARLEGKRAQRQQLLEQSFALNEQLRALRATLSHLTERDRALEMQQLRAELKLQEIAEQWQRLAPNEPLTPLSEPLPEKPPVARAELERLRRALSDIGEVNPNAPDEYARLSERYTHLQHQREDLERTCAQLEHQLHELDRHAREQFLSTFEAVRQAFQMRFEQLFEGGHAELILTDARDPLSAGVIVEAQPPHKRRQRLELLSGGERALTAIALLFAFSTVKPSPLLVLDEVDAALDGRNVQRFADYLRQIAEHSQVLIVTHNPITTAVAQQWLGVSMTGGVSRIVPYTPPESLRADDGAERTRALIQPVNETTPQP